MRMTVWSENADYKLTAFGGGWGFELLEKATDKSVWVQDDDAHTMESEYEALGGGTDALAPLFDMYSELASTPAERGVV